MPTSTPITDIILFVSCFSKQSSVTGPVEVAVYYARLRDFVINDTSLNPSPGLSVRTCSSDSDGDDDGFREIDCDSDNE